MLLLLLFVGCVSSAAFVAKCGDGRTGVSMKEVEGSVEGRYRVEWCTNQPRSLHPNLILTLRYNYNHVKDIQNCQKYRLVPDEGSKHSHIEETVDVNLNCSNVCFSTDLDMIFNDTCYYINIRNGTSNTNHLQYVYNNYTMEHFTKSEPLAEVRGTNEDLTALWSLSYVPAVDYTMRLCVENNTTKAESCRWVEENCTVSAKRTQLECRLGALPAGAAAHLYLHLHGPWTSARIFEKLRNSMKNFRVPEPERAPKRAAWAGWLLALLGALGAALLLAALLLAALAARRLRRRYQNRLHIWDKWQQRLRSKEEEKPVEEPAARRVLLLYARDCDKMMAVIGILRDMLQLAGMQVLDLFSEDTVRDAASAPAEWLRRVLERADVRVLLLATPIAASLYSAELVQRGARLTLEQPLLGRRAVYRRPAAGDALLQLALRLVRHAALAAPPHHPHHPHHPHAHHKFYVASISKMEVEMFGEVTPLRRYELPAAAQLLLHHLAGTPPPGALAPLAPPAPQHELQQQQQQQLEQLQRRLADAVREMLEFVEAHEDYLADVLQLF